MKIGLMLPLAEDETSGELKNLGFKMRAEGETAYVGRRIMRTRIVRTVRFSR